MSGSSGGSASAPVLLMTNNGNTMPFSVCSGGPELAPFALKVAAA